VLGCPCVLLRSEVDASRIACEQSASIVLV
jgi:hypothetical protein